ncbi:MAG: hypothetical protein J6L73_03845 [Muribaculaceae bacterium]|nr:hypothetical protein [Muribaculaceae bacterium]
MIRIITVFFIVLISISGVSAQDIARVEYKEFDSKNFPFKRPYLIITPEDYDTNVNSDYDVIYVFDSQWRSRFGLVHNLMHYGCQELVSPNENAHQYIVVGIPSQYIPEYEYDRNRDFYSAPVNIPLPEGMPEGYGCAPQFKKFLKDELMPYIDSHYRTTGHTLAVGHSLSASFILDALETEDMFDDYIALSPNLCWDNNLWADRLINFNFNDGKPRYFFFNMANEREDTGWGPDWRPAYDKVKNHFESTALPDNIVMKFNESPQYDHDQSYQPVIIDALKDYCIYRLTHGHEPVSKEVYPVHIELKGKSLSGDVYITGNQDALANWNPMGVKMNQINDSTYTIDLNLRLPAEYKFTQGTWEQQPFPKNTVPGNLSIDNPKKTVKYYETY